MKIGIIGTRGIPNNYGGFEQFAEFLSKHLVERGHQVLVYNSHNHPFQFSCWNGVEVKHQFDPEFLIGTAGQFIYDFNCILDARSRQFDIILQLGYTSSSIWSFLFPKGTIVVTNMDGLEWRRAKYSRHVKRFLKYAERLGAYKSHYLVADSPAIKEYLQREYAVDSTFIPYGAVPFLQPDESKLKAFDVDSYSYDILIARLEPENNIELVLDGVVMANTGRRFFVVGNTQNSFGRYLVNKFRKQNSIRFLGPIYDQELLSNLRYYSNIYFHGHSVGGTNPSLLEAMASSALICAHQNVFNSTILGIDAYYFETSADACSVLMHGKRSDDELKKIDNNFKKIERLYNWQSVCRMYEELFESVVNIEIT